MTACTCVTNVFVRVLEWSEMTAVRAVSGQHHAIEMHVHCMHGSGIASSLLQLARIAKVD